jgi:hypothetical protein
MTGINTKAECSHYRALPGHYSLSQPYPGHKRKNGLISRLYPQSFKSFEQPTQETEYLVPGQTRSPHSSPGFHLPLDV